MECLLSKVKMRFGQKMQKCLNPYSNGMLT